MKARGFTLLEVIAAMAILSLSLMAIFSINSQAIYSHVYAKKLTVATLLARSKMTDIEQELFDKGFQVDDDEQAGDFSDDGWPSFKWRAKVIAPKTQGLTPEQLLGAVFGMPMGGDSKGGEGGGLGALGALFGGGAPPGANGAAGGAAGLAGAAMGPMAGIIQQQFGQMVDLLTKSVREVHLTVTWKEGKLTESFDVVTHVVAMGPNADRNGANPQGTVSNTGTGAPGTGAPGTGAPGTGAPGTGAPGTGGTGGNKFNGLLPPMGGRGVP